MKRLLSVVCSVVLLCGCFGSQKEVEPVAVETQAAVSAPVMVVNVLDKAMYDDAHIKGSINVPMDQVMAESEKWDKNAAIVLYCSNTMCTSSSEVARQLVEKGFTNVAVYEGGMAEWFQIGQKDAEYIVEGPHSEVYLTMEVAPQPAPVEVENVTTTAAIKKITAVELQKLMKEANLLA